MKLTVPGNQGFHPQVGADDLVTKGGKADALPDVTLWLLTKLGDLHSRAKQIISDHLASIRPPEAGGTGYSAGFRKASLPRYHRKAP